METEQEKFWKSTFGNQYTGRTIKAKFYTTRIKMWSDILPQTLGINSVFEIGTNIGLQLDIIKLLNPNRKIETAGIEINKKAFLIAKKKHKVQNISVLDFKPKKKFDLTFSAGVLIHLPPEKLKHAYKVLYNSSNKYIVISEYFNTSPVEVVYRGHSNKLFKRDFAKEIKNLYDLELIDYKFMWSEDNFFPCDNTTWFLFKKKN
jgi:spore coat polysaccharide biosynthesis protein SpsF